MTSRRRALAVGVAVATLAGCGSGGPKTATGRVIEIKALDTLRFDPSSITARPGEVITFRITNEGRTHHEFVIGDADYQAMHESSMGSGHGGHAAMDGGAAVDLSGRGTRTLTYTMPAEPPVFVCHVSNHDDAGMRGTVTYSSAS